MFVIWENDSAREKLSRALSLWVEEPMGSGIAMQQLDQFGHPL